MSPDNVTPIRPPSGGAMNELISRLETARIDLATTTNALEAIEDVYARTDQGHHQFDGGELYALLRLIRGALRESIQEIERVHGDLRATP